MNTKKYGWGWRSASWQGWVILGVYLWFVVWSYMNTTLFNFIPDAIILTAIFIAMYYKTRK